MYMLGGSGSTRYLRWFSCGFRGRRVQYDYIHIYQEGLLGNFCSGVWGDIIQVRCIRHRGCIKFRYILEICAMNDNEVHICTSFLRVTGVVGLLPDTKKIVGCARVGDAGNVFPATAVSDPDMHHGTCGTHVPWCMTGSLSGSSLWSQWRVKRSRFSRRKLKPQFYVSGKRPIVAMDIEASTHYAETTIRK